MTRLHCIALALALGAAVTAAACDIDLGLEAYTFVCETDDDCRFGKVCRVESEPKVCGPPGSAGGTDATVGDTTRGADVTDPSDLGPGTDASVTADGSGTGGADTSTGGPSDVPTDTPGATDTPDTPDATATVGPCGPEPGEPAWGAACGASTNGCPPDFACVSDAGMDYCLQGDLVLPSGMVYVPAGVYHLGCRDGDGCPNSELEPAHRAFVSAGFAIDRFEVDSLAFCEDGAGVWVGTEATRCGDSPDLPQHCFRNDANNAVPANCVSFDSAEAYCGLVAKRLCTAAEWEAAARGADSTPSLYPWSTEGATPGVESVFEGTQPQNFKPQWHTAGRSPFGAYHMAGNVAEWVSDCAFTDFAGVLTSDAPEPCRGQDIVRAPGGFDCHSQGGDRLLRGGAYDDTLANIRATRRQPPPPDPTKGPGVGFRCCKDIPPPTDGGGNR